MILLTLLLFACGGSGSVKLRQSSINDLLPPDKISDNDRPIAEYFNDLPGDTNSDSFRDPLFFNFKTLLSTNLQLKVNLFDLKEYDSDEVLSLKPGVVEQFHKSDDLVNATIVLTETASGRLVYAGKLDEQGNLNTKIVIPAHLKETTLMIQKSGYHKRSVTIDNTAQISSLTRTMSMVTSQTSLNNDLVDSDGDLIPDVYDAFPSDPLRAFKITVPLDKYLTIAFEDNFPNLGDGDYNDFVTRYTITEILNANNQIVELQGEVFAIARGAGYDHRFGIYINFPNASGRLDIYNANHLCNQTATRSEQVLNFANIVLFERTKQVFTKQPGQSGHDNTQLSKPVSYGHRASFALIFDQPIERSAIDPVPFDPYLYIHNTSYDVHLLGKNSLPNSNNPPGSDGFRDGNGYPRALLVPIGWQHPIEYKRIDQSYSTFANWRTSIGQTNSDWYFFPVTNNVYNKEIPDQCIPQIVNTSPTNGENDVRLNSKIAVTFSKPIDNTTVDTTSFKVNDYTGSVEGFFEVNQNVVTFTPKFELEPNRSYTTTIESQLKMNDGSFLPNPFMFNFTTTVDPSFILIKELEIYHPNATSSAYQSFGNEVVFAANTTNFGIELFKSDGSFFGTNIVTDILFQAGSANPQDFIELKGNIYFIATADVYGKELMVSNATISGTKVVKDIAAGTASSNITKLVKTKDYIYFVANDQINGKELWRSDGTLGGSLMLKDIYPTGNSNPSQLTPLDVQNSNELFFVAYTANEGYELWKTDGTTTGTVLVKDISVGTSSSNPTSLISFFNKIYFAANDNINGIELWSSDGTTTGTTLLKNIYPFSSSSSPQNLFAAGNRFYFLANDGTTGKELWVSNGSANGTTLLLDLNPGFSGSSIQDFQVVDNQLFFTRIGSQNNSFLYKTNGTTAGTYIMKEFNSQTIGNLVSFNYKLYFTVDDGIHGNEMWVSNGTPQTTYLLKDYLTGASSSNPTSLFVHQNELYFSLKYEFSSRPEEFWVYRP